MTPVFYAVSTGEFVLADFGYVESREVIRIYDVFVSAGTPTWTYVERKSYEKEFKSLLSRKGKQIYLYGPSGSGKTCLYETVLEKENKRYVMVPCKAYYNDILVLNYSIYKQAVGILKLLNPKADFDL